MTTKFVEVTLSHKYRVTDKAGFISGGPMYVMERRLNMKWLAIFFALATVVSSFGSGNLPQSNNIANGLSASFGIPNWASGFVLACFLGAVILGGIRRIVGVAEKIVPLMAAIYVLGALIVIVANYDQIGASFLSIFSDAFTGSAAAASSPGKLRSAPQGRVISHQFVLAGPPTARYPLPVEALPRRHSVRRGEASRVLVRDFW